MSKLFNQIRAKLIERETTIKRRIADILEKEQGSLKARVTELMDQMQCI